MIGCLRQTLYSKIYFCIYLYFYIKIFIHSIYLHIYLFLFMFSFQRDSVAERVLRVRKPGIRKRRPKKQGEVRGIQI